MKIKIVLLMSLMMALMPLTSIHMSAASLPVELQAGYIDPTYDQGKPQKGPVLVPELSLEDYTLTFSTPCYGWKLELIDENDQVVYATIITSDTLDQGLARIPLLYENATDIVTRHTKEAFHLFGDPSMEIYTARPTPFNKVSVKKYNNYIHLTLQESAKMTFFNTSTGVVETFESTSVSYPYAIDLRICISKHNKIPLIIDKDVLCLQNEDITSSINYEADEIKVGTNVTTVKSPGDFVISSGNTVLKGNTVELHDNTLISASANVEISN